MQVELLEALQVPITEESLVKANKLIIQQISYILMVTY